MLTGAWVELDAKEKKEHPQRDLATEVAEWTTTTIVCPKCKLARSVAKGVSCPQCQERRDGKREELIKLFQDIAKTGPDAKSPGLRRAVHKKIREMLTGEKNTMANIDVWQKGIKIATDFASEFEQMNGGKKHHLLESFIGNFKIRLAKSPKRRWELSGRSGKRNYYPVTLQQLLDEIPFMLPTIIPRY